jgi:hypothetical protein
VVTGLRRFRGAWMSAKVADYVRNSSDIP